MFVFYDFETTGTSPEFDQPIQFAAIRTDEELNPVERINIRCRLAPHILPSPWALVVTGVNPQILNDPVLPSWYQFSETLRGLIVKWSPSTWTGFNTLSFDEEFIRQTFYQNLQPNLYETQSNGNDRLDIMRLVYACWHFEQKSFQWPYNEKGRVSFRLDQLAKINGFSQHNAHDALGDVEATIYMAQLVRNNARTIWDKTLENRNKAAVLNKLQAGGVFEYIERFGASPPIAYLGTYCGSNTKNGSEIGFFRIGEFNPSDYLDASDSELDKVLEASPKAIFRIAVNKTPSLYEKIDLSPELIKRAALISSRPDFQNRIGNALARRYDKVESREYVEQKIYDGFYSKNDKILLEKFHSVGWESKSELLKQISDERLKILGERILKYESPELFSEQENLEVKIEIQRRWDNPATNKESWTTFSIVEKQIDEIEQESALSDAKLEELKSFYAYKKTTA